jgi:CDP-L-myo-inositol myo-inositolphosphotransferase
VTVVSFASLAQAEEPVAGIAAIARLIAEAWGCTAGEMWLVLEDHQRLSGSARCDIERLPVDASRLRWLSPQEFRDRSGEAANAPMLFLRGDLFVTADCLGVFMSSGHRRLIRNGEPLAERLDREAAGDAAAPETGAVLPLRDSLALRRLLLKRTVKPMDGPVSRYLNRPVSRALSTIVVGLPGLRPWHMTMATAAAGAAMFLALLSGGHSGLVAGGLLYQLASIVDGVDGELARVTYRSSPAGATLDTSVDMATLFLFFLGITIELGRRDSFFFYLGGALLLLLIVGMALLAWLVRRTKHPGSFNILKHFYSERFSSGSDGRNPVVSLVTAIFSRDVFALVFALLLIAGLANVVLWSVTVAATLWVVLILAAAPQILRQA